MEREEFLQLLQQDEILKNLVLTGLRGVGKTVLLDTLKPLAIQNGWVWVGTDLSESATVSEQSLAQRLLTDLAVATSGVAVSVELRSGIGFNPPTLKEETYMNYAFLASVYDSTPGLVLDKLKCVLRTAWTILNSGSDKRRGIVFAYDEAQNLSDRAQKEEYPLSVLLDVFQSIQKEGLPLMLALTGLPTLFPKLVEARTYAERMFRVLFLRGLDETASREAIEKPIEDTRCPVKLSKRAVNEIINLSGGYPYFIQFSCREVYDATLQRLGAATFRGSVPAEEILRKLDTDFFAGRWARATDRQRDLLIIIAELEHCDAEFTVQEIVDQSRESSKKPFGSSHVNQMLAKLGEAGLVYKNRHGKYSFAVPMLGAFIKRQTEEPL